MKPLELFEHVPIFAGLTTGTLEFLAEVAPALKIKPGEVIVQENTLGNMFYIISEGEVEVVKKLGTPEETVLARLQPMDFFGEMSIIEVVNRSASVRALQPTELFSLRNSDLHHLYQKSPEQYAILILNLARDLSRRLRALDEQFAARAH
jgi:CRP-like cAMP-binding protein